jgi:hypothetical protein
MHQQADRMAGRQQGLSHMSPHETGCSR